MSYWLREASGWILMGIGLSSFAICYFVFLLQKRILEAACLAFIGFIIFRGGIHLLKVAMAARAAADLGPLVETRRSRVMNAKSKYLVPQRRS